VGGIADERVFERVASCARQEGSPKSPHFTPHMSHMGQVQKIEKRCAYGRSASAVESLADATTFGRLSPE
jgi:hypothetical protein